MLQTQRQRPPAPDSAEVPNELATRISFRDSHNKSRDILNNNSNAELKIQLDKRFDIYLNTRMSSKDDNEEYFIKL